MLATLRLEVTPIIAEPVETSLLLKHNGIFTLPQFVNVKIFDGTSKQSDIRGLWKFIMIQVADTSKNSKSYQRESMLGADKADFTVK